MYFPTVQLAGVRTKENIISYADFQGRQTFLILKIDASLFSYPYPTFYVTKFSLINLNKSTIEAQREKIIYTLKNSYERKIISTFRCPCLFFFTFRSLFSFFLSFLSHMNLLCSSACVLPLSLFPL